MNVLCSMRWSLGILKQKGLFHVIITFVCIAKFGFRFLFKAVTFKEHSGFLNLARVDLVKISTGSVQGLKYFHLPGSIKPLQFIQVGRIRDCYIFKPYHSLKGSSYQKKIDMFLVAGEFERIVCMIGHVTGFPRYNGPLGFGSCQFMTKWDTSMRWQIFVCMYNWLHH